MITCDCGKPYYPESTGEGPCHKTCESCLGEIPENNNRIASEHGKCLRCYAESLEEGDRLKWLLDFAEKRLMESTHPWVETKRDLLAMIEAMRVYCGID